MKSKRDGYMVRRTSIQDLIRHALIACGAEAPIRRAPRGNLQRSASGSPRTTKERALLSQVRFRTTHCSTKTPEQVEAKETRDACAAKKPKQIGACHIAGSCRPRRNWMLIDFFCDHTTRVNEVFCPFRMNAKPWLIIRSILANSFTVLEEKCHPNGAGGRHMPGKRPGPGKRTQELSKV